MNAVTPIEPALPAAVARRGISEPVWRTLMNSVYPGAKGESVIMVVDYCKARGLDPLKKPCHIVPMQVKTATGDYVWRDVVMPGIYEYRTTASRTAVYMGHSKPEYGPLTEYLGVMAPEYCEMTIYRWSDAAKARAEFPVRVYFRECVATRKDKKTAEIGVNERWSRAPIQMMTKCTEAAGLREGFPEEFGGTHTVEELEGKPLEIDAEKPDPRGDKNAHDYDLCNQWVNDIRDMFAEHGSDDEKVKRIINDVHMELNPLHELYIAVLDKLASEKIITKANWNKALT